MASGEIKAGAGCGSTSDKGSTRAWRVRLVTLGFNRAFALARERALARAARRFISCTFSAFMAAFTSFRARRAALRDCLKAFFAALCSAFTRRNCFLAAAASFSTAAALAINTSADTMGFWVCFLLDRVFISQSLTARLGNSELPKVRSQLCYNHETGKLRNCKISLVTFFPCSLGAPASLPALFLEPRTILDPNYNIRRRQN